MSTVIKTFLINIFVYYKAEVTNTLQQMLKESDFQMKKQTFPGAISISIAVFMPSFEVPSTL